MSARSRCWPQCSCTVPSSCCCSALPTKPCDLRRRRSPSRSKCCPRPPRPPRRSRPRRHHPRPRRPWHRQVVHPRPPRLRRQSRLPAHRCKRWPRRRNRRCSLCRPRHRQPRARPPHPMPRPRLHQRRRPRCRPHRWTTTRRSSWRRHHLRRTLHLPRLLRWRKRASRPRRRRRCDPCHAARRPPATPCGPGRFLSVRTPRRRQSPDPNRSRPHPLRRLSLRPRHRRPVPPHPPPRR